MPKNAASIGLRAAPALEKPSVKKSFPLILLVFIVSASVAWSTDGPENLYPEAPSPFMGDWVGKWTAGEERQPDIAAQVIAMGNNEYQAVIVRQIYARTRPFVAITGHVAGDVLRFDDGFFYGQIAGDRFTGGRRDDKNSAFEMERFVLTPPALGAAPPAGAIVLFDGSGFDEWGRFPRGASWDIIDDSILQANPDVGYIVTERSFRDCKLHLEFRTPFLPEARGQSRGNSGVFLQHYHEVQILDSYGSSGYWDDCGAIYQISAPYVNMCLPPLQWQTFEIEFRAARFDESGDVRENARMTVVHNGVIVQKDHEIPHGTSFSARSAPQPPVKEPLPIRLQAHRNRVQFRNIWIVDQSDEGS